MKRHHTLLPETVGMMALQRHSWEAISTPLYPLGAALVTNAGYSGECLVPTSASAHGAVKVIYSAHGYLDDLRRLECYGTFVGENVAVV